MPRTVVPDGGELGSPGLLIASKGKIRAKSPSEVAADISIHLGTGTSAESLVTILLGASLRFLHGVAAIAK